MLVVTAGNSYLDIDAYAGVVAYAELLRLQGKDAVAASTAPFNSSVTPMLKSLDTGLVQDYAPSKQDSFIVIDLSEPDYFDSIVSLDRVVEVIDHHPGTLHHWQDHPGHVQIERIGAACTIVVERWVQAGLLNRMSATSAKLLLAGILDNSLNLKAHITSDRDRNAAHTLQNTLGDDGTFASQYFSDCQNQIEANLDRSLRDDFKSPSYPGYNGRLQTSQLAVWDASRLISEHAEDIRQTMGSGDWYVNIISIQDGKSSFLTNGDAARQYLQIVTAATPQGSLLAAVRLWLRKEIMQAAIERFGAHS